MYSLLQHSTQLYLLRSRILHINPENLSSLEQNFVFSIQKINQLLGIIRTGIYSNDYGLHLVPWEIIRKGMGCRGRYDRRKNEKWYYASSFWNSFFILTSISIGYELSSRTWSSSLRSNSLLQMALWSQNLILNWLYGWIIFKRISLCQITLLVMEQLMG